MKKEYTIYIKNMVCNRCIMAVDGVFKELNYPVTDIKLGEVSFLVEQGEPDFKFIDDKLRSLGFELIEDKKVKLVEKIKALVVNMIHHQITNDLKVNYSDYIARETGKDYHYLSNLFSEKENITIEKYIILQKIEKVKELLVYDELSLSEIAWQLQYSSTAHLSKQFKQITGFTPTQFKNLKEHNRHPLDEIR